MALTIYDYDKDGVDTALLNEEIVDAGLPTPIYVEDDGAASPGENLHVGFDPALSGGQETTLNATVASHPQTAPSEIPGNGDDNLAATTDPTANDDADDGYAVDSIWVNRTTRRVWQCFDATVGAAVWTELTNTVDSVNGETGVVALDAGDVGADAAGTAASAVSAHEGASDPHTGYQLEAEKGQANGYASLDGSGTVPTGEIPVLGTTKIADDAITNAKLANASANTVKANPTGSAADLQDVAVGANTVLGRQGGNLVAAQVATGQVADDAITNAKAANMAAATVKGRAVGAGTGDPTDLTATQLLALLNTVIGRAFQLNAGPFTTASGAFVTAFTFAPGGGALTGTYRLGFRCEFNSDAGGDDCEIRLRRTDGGATVLAYNEEEPDDGDDWNTFSHFQYFVLTGATPTFDVQISNVGGSDSSVRRVSWEWERVA